MMYGVRTPQGEEGKMIKNPELLKLAVKNMENEQESWNQASWAVGPATGETVTTEPLMRYMCATTMCLAGHIVSAAGYRMVAPAYVPPGQVTASGTCIDAEGNLVGISQTARELIGLSYEDGETLFMGMDSDLGRFKRKITAVTGVEFE